MAGTEPGTTPEPSHLTAGAVVIAAGRCLALQRGRTWVFPKGHVEPGERFEDTAVREVREETGLDIAIDRYLGTTTYRFRGATGRPAYKRVEWFAAHPVGGTLQLEPRFEAARWIAPGEAVKVLTFPADRDLAERAFARGADASVAEIHP